MAAVDVDGDSNLDNVGIELIDGLITVRIDIGVALSTVSVQDRHLLRNGVTPTSVFVGAFEMTREKGADLVVDARFGQGGAELFEIVGWQGGPVIIPAPIGADTAFDSPTAWAVTTESSRVLVQCAGSGSVRVISTAAELSSGMPTPGGAYTETVTSQWDGGSWTRSETTREAGEYVSADKSAKTGTFECEPLQQDPPIFAAPVDLPPADIPPTDSSDCGSVTFPVGTTGSVVVKTGDISCTDATELIERYFGDDSLQRGGNTQAAEFDGWLCVSPTATAAELAGYGAQCTRASDGTEVVVVPMNEAGDPASSTPCSSAPCAQSTVPSDSDDLAVGTPLTVPSCDGTGIVVVHSAVQPGSYGEEVSAALASHPGSSYLRTDRSCPSLRQRSPEGNPIYAVYKPISRSETELCDAVRREGGDAYGKWLDTTSDPSLIVAC